MSDLLRVSMFPDKAGLVDVGIGPPLDAANAASELLNAEFMPAGQLACRGGYVCRLSWALPPGGQAIKGIFCGRLSGGSSEEFLVVSKEAYVDIGGTGEQGLLYHEIHFPWGRIDMDAEKIWGAAGTIPDYLVFGNTILIASPERHISSYTKGAAPRIEESVPYGSFLTAHQGRLFVGRLMDDNGSIAYSAAGKWRDFESPLESGRLSVSDRSAELVTGLSEPFYGDVYVFTQTSINRLRVGGDGLPVREVVSRGVGCDGNHSIVTAANDLLFASSKGVHSLITTQRYGDVESQFLSAPIQRLWDRIPPSNIARAWAAYLPNSETYALAIDLGAAAASSINRKTAYAGSNSAILVCHVPTRRWAVWDWPATAIDVMEELFVPNGPHLVVGGSPEGVHQVGPIGMIDRYDILHVDPRGQQTPYYAGYERPVAFRRGTPWIDCGDSAVRKNFRRAIVYFRSGANAKAKLLYQIDDKGQMVTDGGKEYWRMKEVEFHLNPGNEKSCYGGIYGAKWNYNQFFADANENWKQVEIPLVGSGARIRLVVEHTAGHRFELMGLELFYIVESLGATDIQETGTEVVEGASLFVPPSATYEVDDDVEV